MENILKDWKHYLGWIISALAIEAAMIAYLIFIGSDIKESMIVISFIIVFIVEMFIDVIKHYIHLQ